MGIESASGSALQSPMPGSVEIAGQARQLTSAAPQPMIDTQAAGSQSMALPGACWLRTSSRAMPGQRLLPGARLFVLIGSAEEQTMRPRTRLQDGFWKGKVFIDGTYRCLPTTDEPRDLAAALEDKNWKLATDDEFQALA
jgi:hypothetical protein